VQGALEEASGLVIVRHVPSVSLPAPVVKHIWIGWLSERGWP